MLSKDDLTSMLFTAVCSGDVNRVKRALSEGADPNATKHGKPGPTPLRMSCDPEITHMLLENGADVDAQDHEGNTPLAWAAHLNSIELVTELLAHGEASVEIKNSRGET